ncbi:hypothetical protein ABFS82_08G196000 [Erythranthe guttata]
MKYLASCHYWLVLFRNLCFAKYFGSQRSLKDLQMQQTVVWNNIFCRGESRDL